LTNIDGDKTVKKLGAHSDSIPIETKTLEDFKCGNCGLPLLIHIFWRGDKYERIVECKKCKISFPLDGNHKSSDPKTNPASNVKAKPAEKDSNNKKDSMVERLVKSW
jgi:hypothetical protein